MRRWTLWLDVALKAALVALLLLALAYPDWTDTSGKAMAWRAIAYPLAAALVPAVWLLRGRRDPYPYDIDILFTLPFVVDTIGNSLGLYESIWWWDDVNHLVNWFILVAAFGCLLVRLPVGRLEAFALAVGFGAVTAIVWELGEYVAFIRSSENELRTAYEDTLGDLLLGLTGSILAALFTITIRWPRTRPR